MKKEKTIIKQEAIKDIRCKANSIKQITKKVCRNNCKYWNKINKKCELNYE